MSRIRIAFLLGLTAALAAGCAGSSPLAGAPLPTATGPLIHVATLPGSSRHVATLDVASGASSVVVSVGNLAGRLVSASTPLTSGQTPSLSMSTSGVAELQLTSPAGNNDGPSIVDVVLSPSVAWSIDLDGGATDESVNMVGGHLIFLDLSAGTTHATIDLPARAGTQVVRESGGASDLTVDTPSSVSSRVYVGGGAASVTIGSVTHAGVGGDRTFAEAGYGAAPQRLDLELHGGVSTLLVQHV
jgi:hypothetical protein